MIKLLKNKEVRKALLWQMLLSAAACAVCFFFDIRAGLTAAGLSLLLMLVFCISTYKRGIRGFLPLRMISIRFCTATVQSILTAIRRAS